MKLPVKQGNLDLRLAFCSKVTPQSLLVTAEPAQDFQTQSAAGKTAPHLESIAAYHRLQGNRLNTAQKADMLKNQIC